MKTVAMLFIFCALIAAPATFAQTDASVCMQTLTPGPGGYPADGQALYQRFTTLVAQARCQVTSPAASMPQTIQVVLSSVPGTFSSTPGTIYASAPLANETFPTGLSYQGFLYELMHQGLPKSVLLGEDVGLDEGLASDKIKLIWRILAETNSTMFPTNPTGLSFVTSAPGVDMANNCRALVCGGTSWPNGPGGRMVSDFYGNVGNVNDKPETLLSVIANDSYVAIDKAIDTYQPTTRDQFLAALDASFPNTKFDGVNPSTWMARDVTAWTGAKDGEIALGIQVHGGFSAKYTQLNGNNWPFSPAIPLDIFLVQWHTNPATGATEPTLVNGRVRWNVCDATGLCPIKDKITATGLGVLDVSILGTFSTRAWHVTTDAIDLHGDLLPGGAMHDDAYLPIVTGEELDPGDIVVVTNGPWGTLNENKDLTVISPIAALTVKTRLGMTIYGNMPKGIDNKFVGVMLIDANGILRSLDSNEFAPMAYDWNERDEAMADRFATSTNGDLRNVDPRNTTNQGIAPGTMYTIYGSDAQAGLTHNDPSIVTTLPLPTEGCAGTPTNDQGRTIIRFTATNGDTGDGRFLYCSGRQINFVSPWMLAKHPGETVTVSLIVNGTTSFRTFEVPVSAAGVDPGIFVIDPVAQTAAAIIATGPDAGHAVGVNGQTVFGGEVLEVFGTGFGQKLVAVPDGQPNPNAADPTAATVTATVGGVAATVQYAGGAPGFVGLDQMNVLIPEGLPSGTNVPLTFYINGIASPAVTLPIK
ncbi:MAG: hypothetical protein ABSH47_25255 [Bryobacteraceae bacterium]|jgi:uncharacterized protein (TIGR03437 family)